MPTTRSATRSGALNGTQAQPPKQQPPPDPVSEPRSSAKRKATKTATEKAQKKRNTSTKSEAANASDAPVVPFKIPPPGIAQTTELLPAKLTFSFEEAKKHLIASDVRFADVFRRLACKPFEKLERIEPFRTLTSSILGQQISWLAARSVRHKFIRLYFPELPEKPDDAFWANPGVHGDKFPTPHQVANTSIAVLRTAGLSARKAEYVQDLAARFDDGRLTSHKVLEADDEELYEMLTAVRGIGRWTVDMFAIFSLRRPNILPAGDLGVQRGVLRWFLSLHNPSYRIEISPKKATEEINDKQDKADDKDTLPSFGPSDKEERPSTPPPRDIPLPIADMSRGGVETTKKRPLSSDTADLLSPPALGLPSLPPAFTPSFNQILEGPARSAEDGGYLPMPLPEGLTVAEMRARLSGKKKIKGAMLSPAEMEALTETWRPYRSLGVYYMWSLAEEKSSK